MTGMSLRLLERGGHGGTARAGPLDEIESIWPAVLACARARASVRACVRACGSRSTPKPLAKSKGERACLPSTPRSRHRRSPLSRAGNSPPLSFHFRTFVSYTLAPYVWAKRARARARRITPPFLHVLSLSLPPLSHFLFLACCSLFDALPPRSTLLRNVTPTSGKGARIEHMTRERKKSKRRVAACRGHATVLRVDPLYRFGGENRSR